MEKFRIFSWFFPDIARSFSGFYKGIGRKIYGFYKGIDYKTCQICHKKVKRQVGRLLRLIEALHKYQAAVCCEFMSSGPYAATLKVQSQRGEHVIAAKPPQLTSCQINLGRAY